mmetsp:Transcript_5577/g.16640  ORF Transcript_5577/g.16640 Transcript_5577/m.16640 type:complete len:153 (-) Transcript_5577:250-708(-)
MTPKTKRARRSSALSDIRPNARVWTTSDTLKLKNATKLPYTSTDETVRAIRLIQSHRKAEGIKEVILGINATVRAMEKGDARMVIVNRRVQPIDLILHIFHACVARKVPILVLNSASDELARCYGVKRLAAVALRKPHNELLALTNGGTGPQ